MPGEGEGFEVEEGEEEKEVAEGDVRVEGGEGEWHFGEVEGVGDSVAETPGGNACYDSGVRIVVFSEES